MVPLRNNRCLRQLVNAVENLYYKWKKQFREGSEMVVPYSKPSFHRSGLIQIRDDAEVISHQQLLALDREVKRLLKRRPRHPLFW